MNIPDEAYRSAENAYRETLTDLRLTEGGGFKVASQVKRSIHAALEAAAPHLRAQAWDACAGAVESATRLVAPDEITPMGARIINKTARNNPYRSVSAGE